MHMATAISRSAILLATGVLAITLTGCGRESDPRDDGELKVVTALFPSYDFARRIAGEDGKVSFLATPGGDCCGFEPTPRDIIEMHEADIVLHWGPAAEPWMADVLRQWDDGEGPLVLDLSEGVDLLTANIACTHHHAPGETCTHHHTAIDPHYWLDPVIAKTLVQRIADAMGARQPEYASAYAERAKEYIAELADLDAKIRETLAECPRNRLVYGDHATFGYFVRRYGLEHVSPYQGVSPDAAPSPKTIADLAKRLKDDDVRAVFFPKLTTNLGVAQVLAEEASLELIPLNTVHNVSAEELDGGATYLSLMEENLEQLRKGLGDE